MPEAAVTAAPFALTELIVAPLAGVSLNFSALVVNVTVAVVAVAATLWLLPAVTNSALPVCVTDTVESAIQFLEDQFGIE